MSVLADNWRGLGLQVWGRRRARPHPQVYRAIVRVRDDANWLAFARLDDSFALKEATKLLAALEVDDRVRDATTTFLGHVLGADATVPSVAPGDEDGTVLLYWKTGPMSLEVEVSSSGAHYLWARDETGEISCLEDGDRRAIMARAKNIVLRMGNRARLHNPHWRQQYVGND